MGARSAELDQQLAVEGQVRFALSETAVDALDEVEQSQGRRRLLVSDHLQELPGDLERPQTRVGPRREPAVGAGEELSLALRVEQPLPPITS